MAFLADLTAECKAASPFSSAVVAWYGAYASSMERNAASKSGAALRILSVVSFSGSLIVLGVEFFNQIFQGCIAGCVVRELADCLHFPGHHHFNGRLCHPVIALCVRAAWNHAKNDSRANCLAIREADELLCFWCRVCGHGVYRLVFGARSSIIHADVRKNIWAITAPGMSHATFGKVAQSRVAGIGQRMERMARNWASGFMLMILRLDSG